MQILCKILTFLGNMFSIFTPSDFRGKSKVLARLLCEQDISRYLQFNSEEMGLKELIDKRLWQVMQLAFADGNVDFARFSKACDTQNCRDLIPYALELRDLWKKDKLHKAYRKTQDYHRLVASLNVYLHEVY